MLLLSVMGAKLLKLYIIHFLLPSSFFPTFYFFRQYQYEAFKWTPPPTVSLGLHATGLCAPLVVPLIQALGLALVTTGFCEDFFISVVSF